MEYSNPRSRSGVLRCLNCGKDNFAFVSFCHSCGEPLEDPAASDFNEDPRVKSGPLETSTTSTARRLGRRESVLGLVLLLLTIGYALFSWQKSASEADAYHQGLAAEQRKDWDAAAAAFGKAGDLQDSPRRKAGAQSKIVERNNLYRRALTAISQQNWTTALSSLRKVQDIQPGYLDSEARIKQATADALNAGLNGLVYLVGGGPDPGLYLRDGQGHATLLPGSDRHSTVHAIAPDRNMFVYDRAGNWQDSFAGPSKYASALFDPFPSKTDRVSVLAEIKGGVLTAVPMPWLDSGGQGVFAASGIWWFSSQPETGSYGYETFYLSFDALTDPRARPERVSDLANNRRVAALDPPRSRVIIAESSTDPQDGGLETTLYLADAGGNIVRRLHKIQGDVWQASVSQDGRRLLYITQDVRTLISQTVWILPLDGGGEAIESHWPRQLQILSWKGFSTDARLTAAFLPQPDAPDKQLPRVIIDRVENGIETLTVHDLSTFAAKTVEQDTPDAIYGRSMSGLSPDGNLLASRLQPGRDSALNILNLRPGSDVSSQATLPALPWQNVKLQFSPLGDYVVASIQNGEGISRGVSGQIYSVAVGQDGKVASQEVTRLATDNLPYDPGLPPATMPSPGYLLAYVTPGRELHAVFLDGSNDKMLAGNVDAVWSLGSRTDLSWWR